MNNAIRWVWILAVGWWLGPLIFGIGLVLSFSIVGTAAGYKMMNSAYNWTTLKFD